MLVVKKKFSLESPLNRTIWTTTSEIFKIAQTISEFTKHASCEENEPKKTNLFERMRFKLYENLG